MRVNFLRKPTNNELIPQDKFVIEKEVILKELDFERFIERPLDDYDFIKEHRELMYSDTDGTYHCIFVTSETHDFGILVESEGHYYARYAAYLKKN